MTQRRGRGEGGVHQRDDGRWVGTLSQGYDRRTGRRLRRTVTGDTKQAVLSRLNSLRRKQPRVSKRGTVSELLDQWLETLEAQEQVAPATHLSYSASARLYVRPLLGDKQAQKLTSVDVQVFANALAQQKATPRNRQIALVVLRRAFEFARELGMVAENPAAVVRTPRAKRRKLQVLTPDAVGRLLHAAAGDRLAAIYTVAIASGARQGELFALTWGDVDFEAGTLTISKSLEEIKGKLRVKEPKTEAGTRVVVLPAFALEALTDHRRRMLAEGNVTAKGPVFPAPEGGYLRKSNFRQTSWLPVRRAAELGEQVRFHDLRHGHASLLLLQGVNARVVQQRLGHADVATTLRTYVHVLEGMDRTAAEGFQALIGSAIGSAPTKKPPAVG